MAVIEGIAFCACVVVYVKMIAGDECHSSVGELYDAPEAHVIGIAGDPFGREQHFLC